MTTHKYRASGPDGRLNSPRPGEGSAKHQIEVTETTVVIPAYGRCPHLPALLCALLDAAESPGEIIVSHSGPDDPTDAVAAISDRITVLHHPERLLAGAARNRGAAIANGQWLAFIDADVRPRPDWLQTLLAAARRAPDRFAVGWVGWPAPAAIGASATGSPSLANSTMARRPRANRRGILQYDPPTRRFPCRRRLRRSLSAR